MPRNKSQPSKRDLTRPGSYEFTIRGEPWQVEVGRDADFGKYAALATHKGSGDTMSPGYLFKDARSAWGEILVLLGLWT